MKYKKSAPDSKYNQIMSGEREPVGSEKGYKNLEPTRFDRMDPDKRREICRKGYLAQQKVLQERKTAQESITKLLSLVAGAAAAEYITPEMLDKAKKDNPNITFYDLVNLKQIEQAAAGSTSAAIYCRDTAGDKPNDKINLTASSLTDEDRRLLETVKDRLEAAGDMSIRD